MQSRNKKIIIISLLVIILALVGGGTFILNKLLHLDTYKDQIIVALQEALQREVRYEKGDFSLRYGPAFTFSHVVVKEKDGSANFITAERLTFKLAVLPLLEKRVVLKEMDLDQPDVELARDKAGVFNISDLLEEKKEALPLQIKGIRIRKGFIRFTDRLVTPEGLATSLEETDLSISRFVRGKSCDFKLATLITGEAKRGNVTLSGTANLAPKDKPLTDTVVNAKILAKNLDAGRFWAYYSRYVPFRKILGQLEIESTFKGKLAEFTSRGSMKISGLRFDYPQIFHAVLTPKDLHFTYDMELAPRDLSVKSLDLTVDGLRVKGSCILKDIHSGDLRITARATTSPFRLEDFGRYIPYGVIVKDPAEFIERHIKGGIYRLDDGKLDGRISQILHMEKGDNYNVLYIRGRVEKGLLTFGPDVPTFNNIKGELEMRGKDFNLHRMSGNFGASPFTLNGRISDYPLDKPSAYPFTMAMTPGQAELAWLLGQRKTGKLFLSGSSTLRLTGDGLTSGYNLSGDWDLTPAAYSYPDLIKKPAGRPNHLSFKGSISKEEAKLSSLNYTLHPMALTAAGDYRFIGKTRLAFDISSNQFPIHETAPMLPLLAKYQPAGRVQATIHGESNQKELKDIRWAGDVSFSGASFKPSENIKNLSDINGTVHFSSDSLETSQMAARLGTSTIYGKGTLTGFNNPILSLVFTSPSLAMSDLGLRVPQREVRATKVQGNVSLKDNNLQIKSLSGQVNNSVMNLAGTVQDLRNPRVDLTVKSPHLEIEDVMLLTELEQEKKKDGPPAKIILKASIQANTGKFKDIPFEKLRTVAMYEDKILYLQPVEFATFGGRVSGKGRLDFGSNGVPRYQVSYALDNVSAERFTRAIGMKKQEITGTLSTQGELTAKGKTGEEIKKTALGSVKIRIEEGSLRRFAVLSKIFSILNVSQLLKFQLPDMVSGGMPYNEITATLSIRDGFVASQDLYLDSDAMNISAVGKMDLVKDELDVTIGVQPLQTVDKVVSNIPIVGWILTGKDRTLITTYFEAKGKVEDPQVKAIPVKSMAKGVFDIFKRVFELPAKLITDTGEVIIGK
ncbi:MAG: AsmA family [Geobacteraceae bacterium]|nr:MAG: AsmA family [Geobacteraceae bacterium]